MEWWRYGYAKYATMGALTGGLLVYGFQLGLFAAAVGAVVGHCSVLRCGTGDALNREWLSGNVQIPVR
jgi:hypothetical protein